MKDEERLLEVPTEEDENVGDIPKKKVKKKKSKEERQADRKVIFWTLLIILSITIFFWLWPKILAIKSGVPAFNIELPKPGEKTDGGSKNYIEYKL